MRNWRQWRRRVWVLLLLGLLGGGITAYRAQEFARRELPDYLARYLSQVLQRPVEIGKVSAWPPGAFSLKGLEVLPGPDEAASPITARRARVYIDWWRLLHGHVQVRRIHLDQAHLRASLDLAGADAAQANVGETLLSLSSLGLVELGLHDSAVDITATLANGVTQPVTIRGIDFRTRLRHDSFVFVTAWNRWSAGGLSAQDLRFAGKGDARTITLTKSHARFQGGKLEAEGTYLTQGGDVAMQVAVRDLPLGDLTQQLGIPEEWAVEGKLNGTIEVSAISGELQRIDGTVRVAQGSIARSRAVFPWTTATAIVDWDRETITLKEIDIRGDGIRLGGQADLRGDPSAPFPERFYRAEGRVEATSAEAVAALARVLAFSNSVPNGWSVRRGTLDFRAHGKVAEMEESHALGEFAAEGLALQVAPRRGALEIAAVRGKFSRRDDRLEVTEVVGTAEGLTAHAEALITPGEGNRGGTFRTTGRVEFTSLATLRQQLPEVPLWEWVLPARPASRGEITFAAHGPTSAPENLTGSGSFRFREFSARVTPAQGERPWTFPVRAVTGRYALEDGDLALRGVRLQSDLFTADAQGTLRDVAQKGPFVGRARLVSSRWRELPPLQGRVPAGLTGGTLALELRTAGATEGPAPLVGTVDLRGATYLAAFHGRQRRLQLETARADFRLAGDRITIPSYHVVSPQFTTTGSGSGRQRRRGREAGWQVHGEGTLVTRNAGELLRWVSGREVLRGGALRAQYVVDSHTSAPERAITTANVRITGGHPVLPPGALPFRPEETRIVALTGRFHSRGGVVRFRDAVWQAPRFRAEGEGIFDGTNLAGDFRLTTRNWQALAGNLVRGLPVAGGTLTLAGRLEGPVAGLRTRPFRGTVTLRGARLAQVSGWNVVGGELDLRTGVSGTLDRLAASTLEGTFSVRNLTLPPLRAGSERLHITVARGSFAREGDRMNLRNLVARAGGARLTGRGSLRGMGTRALSHSFALAARGESAASLLPLIGPVPGQASGGRYTASLSLSGTPARPVAHAEGRAEVTGARWIPPGKKAVLPIERAAAHFVREGDHVRINNAELRIPGGRATLAGMIQGLYAPTGTRHHVRLSWRLQNASGWASRFLPVPGWFTGGLFTGEAKLSGNLRRPATSGSGRFEVRNAGFMPPQPILGGPVRPIDVRWARGLFRRGDGKTYLTDLDLNTSVGTATGTVTSDDRGNADLQAKAVVTRLEALVDLWPGFKDRLRGGSGEMHLALKGPLGRPRDLRGPVTLIGRGGSFTVENVDELYASHPFEELSARLLLEGAGQVRFQEIRMRGPKANLDGRGLITGKGQVDIRGKGWFAEGFTKKLFKPRILWPVAKLVGFRRLKSDFKIRGTLREARLDAGITDGLLWKLAIRKRVPEPLRRIATGDVPLWSADNKSRVAARVTSRARSAYSVSTR